MPSMPVALERPRRHPAAGRDLDTYPGVWRHGDWVRVTPRGSYVIYGRSDSTLNRGGVRMGTADFYAVVESFNQVADSLVIDTTDSVPTKGSCCASWYSPPASPSLTSSRNSAGRCALSCPPGTYPTGSSSSTRCHAR